MAPQVTPWERAETVAARQHGLVTRQQCLAAGLQSTSLVRAIRAGGRWQRVVGGVYATFTGPLGPAHLMAAALLVGGPSAQLTGLTALTLYGCTYLPTDPRTHVLVPVDVRRAHTALVRLHRTERLPRPRMRQGWPVSPPERAAIVAARHLTSLRDVRAMLAEVVQRRLTSVERLEAALDDGRRQGSALPRRVLAELSAGPRSAPELELRDLLSQRPHLLLRARWNYRIDLGGRFVLADVCWPHARVVVEVDSVEHHGLGDRPEYTARRRAALVAAGWAVLSISPRRIREEPEAVLAEIEALVGRVAA